MANAKSDSKDTNDAIGWAFGLFAIVATLCWLFAKYSNHIYFHLKMAALLCAIPFALMLMISIFKQEKTPSQISMAIIGLALAAVMYSFAQNGLESLGVDIVQHSKTVANGINFWTQLTPFGQSNIGGNLTGAFALAAAILLTFFMGLYSLWQAATDHAHEDSFVLRSLRLFRPKTMLWFICGLLAFSWALTSGLVFSWFSSFK